MSWDSILQLVKDALNSMLQVIIDAFVALATWLIDLLPDFSTWTTMPTITNATEQFFNAVNWIFPVDTLVQQATLFFTSVTIYFAIKAFLRWL